jgi:hypothetical protein
MSYSLYTYLKENPRLNGPKVNYNWSALLRDNAVPASVKAELNELISHKIVTLTDAVLFWSDLVQQLRMLDDGVVKTVRGGKREWLMHSYPIYPDAFSSQFALTVYSYSQLEPEAVNMQNIYKEIFNRDNERELFCSAQNWTIDKVRELCKDTTMYRDKFTHVYLNNKWPLTDADCYTLWPILDESFLMRITGEQLRQVKQLIQDVDTPAIKFKSLNELERAHDERTDREVAKIAKDGLIMLEYNPRLVELATTHGFTLPESNLVMIKRGKQHNNCVATYFNKHRHWSDVELPAGHTVACSRVFFTETATLELSIEYSSDCIVSTNVLQYKGRFNKDATRDKALIAFRIALVGMPAEILAIRSNVK